MRFVLTIRYGSKLITNEDLISIKEMRLGDIVELHTLLPDEFPTSNYGKCTDRIFSKVNNVETCTVHLETAYK